MASDLLTLLPFLKGWKYEDDDFGIDNGQSAFVIKPGAEKKIFDELTRHRKGFLLFFNFILSNPFAEVVIKTPPDFDLHVSPWVLLQANLTAPDNVQFWCSPSMIPSASSVSVPVANTPVVLGTALVMRDYAVSITAKRSNKGAVYVGPTSAATLAATAARKPLSPGDEIELKNIGALSHVWVNADNNGDGVDYLYEYPDVVNADANFSVNFSPSYPLPFDDGFQVYVNNPAIIPSTAGGGPNQANCSVFSYHIGFIKIVNESDFLKSLAELPAARGR